MTKSAHSREMPLAALLISLVLPALSSANAHASALEEARALQAEGMEILREARESHADTPERWRQGLDRLERALKLLERFGENGAEADLREDITSLIFWTRKTMPMDLSFATGRTTSSPPAANPARVSGPEGQRALERAEAYAQANSDKPLLAAARFLRIADEYKDLSQIAFKAISRAQHFQQLSAMREQKERAREQYQSLSPDERLVADGDAASERSDFDAAIRLYSSAIETSSTIDRLRRLAHAQFNRAQQYRDEYSRAYVKAAEEYRRAQASRNKAAAARAAAKARALGAVSHKAIELYSQSSVTFGKILSRKRQKDIDADVHIALCEATQSSKVRQKRAKERFISILRKYHGALESDTDRTLYAVARSYAGSEAAEEVARELRRVRGQM